MTRGISLFSGIPKAEPLEGDLIENYQRETVYIRVDPRTAPPERASDVQLGAYRAVVFNDDGIVLGHGYVDTMRNDSCAAVRFLISRSGWATELRLRFDTTMYVVPVLEKPPVNPGESLTVNISMKDIVMASYAR